MLYRIFHPHHPNVCFLYDDTLPQAIRRVEGQDAELLPLRFENTNVEDFFFCMVKAKVVHIEDRQVGFALVNDQKITIARPYDCRWAANRLLEIQEKDALFMMDRMERRYLLTLNDADMRITQKEWTQFQREGFLPEGMDQGFRDNDFTQQFGRAKKGFADQSEAWETQFQTKRSTFDAAFQEHQDPQTWQCKEGNPSAGPMGEQRQAILDKQAAFRAKMEMLVQKASSIQEAMANFPEATLREKFAQKKQAQAEDREDVS